MKIGTLDGVLTARGQKIPWEDLYRMAGELGFDGLELGVHRDYDKSQLWETKGREQLNSVSKETGVPTSSICLHSYWIYSFASPEEETRKRAQRIAEEGAVAVAEMGAKNILIPLTCPSEVDDATARKRWIEGISAAAPAAESAGAVFCLENVGKSFANRPEDIVDLVDAVNSPAVQVYYDPGNAVHGDLDPLKGISLLGKRIAHIHVKEVGGTYLGEGKVPWGQIIPSLRDVGYDGWLIFETASTEDPRHAAAKNLAWIRKLIS
jgi:sugar phosphate isomerase/epimerase